MYMYLDGPEAGFDGPVAGLEGAGGFDGAGGFEGAGGLEGLTAACNIEGIQNVHAKYIVYSVMCIMEVPQ